MPLGILNSGALVQVAKEAGQQAETAILDNLIKCWSRMPARNRANALWLINQDIEPQLYTMSLSVGTGGSVVFLPGGVASATPYSTLFGRPIIPIEQCATWAISALFCSPTSLAICSQIRAPFKLM